jgi:hypothetical protein
MTKKSTKNQIDAMTQLFVYGEDEAGKPKGARFPSTEMDKLFPVVNAQKLKFFESSSKELGELGMKLPVGRIYARGKSFIPNIRRDLYDKIVTEVEKLQDAFDRRSEQSATGNPSSSATTDATATTLASGLPQDWQSIAAGHLVLVQESLAEGWWEALVVARENDILTLRYRDFPKVPKFERHVSNIAMINPGPV